jgi:hypothetical protein
MAKNRFTTPVPTVVRTPQGQSPLYVQASIAQSKIRHLAYELNASLDVSQKILFCELMRAVSNEQLIARASIKAIQNAIAESLPVSAFGAD